MTEFDPSTHHRRSIRLRNYDYSQAGAYFITICTHEHKCTLGEIPGGVMRLNQFGRIVEDEWQRTPKLRPYVDPDVFTIMPNHMHGILVITDDPGGILPHAHRSQQFGSPVSGSIPMIIRLFKATVTLQINQLRKTRRLPVWQRNYHEHVIRDERDLVKIREYIVNNPIKWEIDRYYRP
jgi:REP element-mobilizing transposase RayT